MTRQHLISLFLIILNASILSIKSLAILSPPDRSKFDIMDEMMINIIRKCKPSFTNMIIFNSKVDETISTLSVLQSSVYASLQLFSETKKVRKRYEFIATQGIIIILYNNTPWMTLHLILRSTNCYDNCTIIIITKYQHACQHYKNFFQRFNRIGLQLAYYICLINVDPTVLTLDWYGNNKNPRWKTLKSNNTSDNFRETYFRTIKKDDICKALNFIRIDKPTIYVGVDSPVKLKPKTRHLFPRNNETEYLFKEEDLSNVKIIEILLKPKFVYYFIPEYDWEIDSPNTLLSEDMENGYIDVMLTEDLTNAHVGKIIQSYPLHYEDYVIISNNRGPATPLEKIVRFYGHVTLVSLVILSTLTLIVIWLKTNFKLAFATFNVLRLLTNTGINVSINTLPLRIFFSMIFLYFLIIHATFSGHLAKFLTVDAFFDNVESAEDLAQSRIEKVHVLNTDWYELFYNTSIYEKLQLVNTNDRCIKRIHNKSNAVCIGIRSWSQEFIKNHRLDSELYVSKKKLLTTTSNFMYRKRFYWKEKFDWALMFLTETKIYNWWIDRERDNINEKIIKQQTNLQTDFRPICLKDLTFAFVFLIGGNSLGLASLFIEFLTYRIGDKVGKILGNSSFINIFFRKQVKRISVRSIRIE